MKRPHYARERGLAAVELALLLPFLLLLLFGVIDAARALQANIIVVNISREGANLVARGNTPLETGSQEVIHALMATAPPLNVNQRGMIYITRVMGVVSGGVSSNVVLDQYRWDDTARGLGFNASRYAPASRIYACPSWQTERCKVPDKRPFAAIMSGKLADGEVIHIVETFYQFDMLLSGPGSAALGLSTFGPDLYSMTIF